jgi:hypothetical protein
MNAIPCILDTPEKPTARKTRPADQTMVDYLHDSETDVVVSATTRSEAYGLEITTILLESGNKIVHHDFGGIGETFFYDHRGRCYMTVEA